MTMALMHGSGKHVVKVGRIAGQFAKPRSNDLEIIEGKEYPSYRGDMVNSIEADDAARIPDPENLLKVGGRGVFLMRQLSDDVVYYDNGSTVEIQFNL